ncbi:MAG: C10 family peptidase [Bacteroidota bacterium]
MTKGYANYYYSIAISFILMINGQLLAQTVITTTNNNNIAKTTQEYGPLLTDTWGGVKCVDDTGVSVYPLNYYTPNHCSPGCVAISLAQVLNYYEWPKTGTGSNVYQDNYTPCKDCEASSKIHTAFFDSVEYDYANMLDEYKYKASTDIQQEAVGKLVYHVTSALQMNFEYYGSTSNVNKVPFVAENFFRFSGHYEYPDSYALFWEKMKDNLKAGNPVQTAIEASRTGDGHAIVVDGYRESDGLYHINWGTYNDWNVKNGWYDIENWTDASPGYNRITGALLDMYPVPQISSVESEDGTSDITVNWITSEFVNHNEYTLEQRVDGGEWELVSDGITGKFYSIVNPTGNVYQFRVKAMTNGSYYDDSWSEIEVFAVNGGYNGYVSLGGDQKSFARQTTNGDLDFTGDYTFETWIRVDESCSDKDVILDQENVFAFEVNDVTATSYSIDFTANSGAKVSTSELVFDEWIHIAVSHSGSFTKMFVNGTLRSESTDSGFNLSKSDKALNFGERYHSGYSGKLNADLDQLRISSIARYSSDFTPSQKEHFDVDANTITYLTFQNVHGVRFKDSARKLSFILKDDALSLDWEFEETENELSNDDLELIASLISVYPNPVVVSNFIKVSITENDLLNSKAIKFNLFDLNGKKLELNSSSEISSNKWTLQLPSINTGIYILQIDGGNFKMNRKIIIE